MTGSRISWTRTLDSIDANDLGPGFASLVSSDATDVGFLV